MKPVVLPPGRASVSTKPAPTEWRQVIAEGVRRHVVLGLTKPIAIVAQRISAMLETRRQKFAFGQRCGTFGPWWVVAPRRCRTRRPPI
jgi:hypothetical protein